MHRITKRRFLVNNTNMGHCLYIDPKPELIQKRRAQLLTQLNFPLHMHKKKNLIFYEILTKHTRKTYTERRISYHWKSKIIVLRPKERQRYKFRSMLFTVLLHNTNLSFLSLFLRCLILPSCKRFPFTLFLSLSLSLSLFLSLSLVSNRIYFS